MKEPDHSDWMPIDTLKSMSHNKVFLLNVGTDKIKCRINRDKIDFLSFDMLTAIEQKNRKVNIEKVVDYETFINSRFKEGFVDTEINISDLGGFEIYEN